MAVGGRGYGNILIVVNWIYDGGGEYKHGQNYNISGSSNTLGIGCNGHDLHRGSRIWCTF